MMRRTTTTLVTMIAVTTFLIIVTTNAAVETAHTTWRNRHADDRGEILDWVVIAAGVVSLAVAAIAFIRPFVMRKLAEIQ